MRSVCGRSPPACWGTLPSNKYPDFRSTSVTAPPRRFVPDVVSPLPVPVAAAAIPDRRASLAAHAGGQPPAFFPLRPLPAQMTLGILPAARFGTEAEFIVHPLWADQHPAILRTCFEILPSPGTDRRLVGRGVGGEGSCGLGPARPTFLRCRPHPRAPRQWSLPEGEGTCHSPFQNTFLALLRRNGSRKWGLAPSPH